MSPLEGEDPLSLWFGVVPALLGALIAIYLIVKIARDRRLMRRVNADRPDPKKFSKYPELQAMIDQLYLSRYQARRKMEAQGSALSAKERDERLHEIDALIDQGLVHAEALRVATEPEAIAGERRAMAEVNERLASFT